MNPQELKDKLLSIIANIEERTDSELVQVIKETLVAAGTGTPIDSVNEQYKFIYEVLDNRFSSMAIAHQNQFDDLWDFYDYWRENKLDTYAARRSFVRSMYKDNNATSVFNEDPFWALINQTIKAIVKPRFENGQYADAVEAAFKEINSRIKEIYRQKTGEYDDGASLMNKAFSPKNPVITLDDLETEDGSNIQKGYMQIFAGAMTGIRNPKAHANHDTTKDEAMPLIQLASHLFNVFEQATSRISETVTEDAIKTQKTPTLFLRLIDPNDHTKLLGIKKLTANASGDTSVVLVLGGEDKSALRLPMTVNVADNQLIHSLKQLLGDSNVVVRKK